MNSQNALKDAQNKDSKVYIMPETQKEQANSGYNKVTILNITQFELTKILYSSGLLAQCDLTPSAKLFLWALCSHYNPNNETMFPSQQTVAKKLGISEKSAQRAVKELKIHGLIDYETKRVNHYVFGPKFFDLVKMSGVVGQNVCDDMGQNVRLTNKNEKRNNRRQVFSKKVFSYEQTQKSKKDFQKGSYQGYQQNTPNKMVPDADETRKMLDECEKNRSTAFNPDKCSRDEAFEWLKNTPAFWLVKSQIAKHLVEKYKFSEFQHILKN